MRFRESSRSWSGAVTIGLLAGLLMPSPAIGQTPSDLIRESYLKEARGDVSGALATMRQVKPAAEAAYFVALRTGWLAYLAGKWADAEVAYRQAIATVPRSIEAQLGLMLPLMAAKRWREVEKYTRSVLKRDPGNVVARIRLAQAVYATGNYQEAALVYDQLHQDYPADIAYTNGLGWSHYQLGMRAEARRAFDAVLAVAPDDLSAKAGRAAP